MHAVLRVDMRGRDLRVYGNAYRRNRDAKGMRRFKQNIQQRDAYLQTMRKIGGIPAIRRLESSFVSAKISLID